MMADGMQYGWVSPAVPKLLSNETAFEITQTQTEWIAGCYLAGCMAGAVFSFLIFRKISRKYSVFMASLPIAIAWLGNLTAPNAYILLAARFVGGMGRNMAFVSVPMYIGEIADPEIRGMLGTFIYIMENVGTVLTYAITPYFPLNVSCSIGLAIAICQMCLMMYLPESPYYLLSNGKSEEAKKCLRIIRMRKDVDQEFEALSAAVNRQTSQTVHFLQLFKVKSNLKALFILFFLRGVQMFSGISVMTMNIHTIFSEVGGDNFNNISAIIYSVMLLTSAMCTMGTMDRFGRKTLMIFSCVIAALALFTEGLYFYIETKTNFDIKSIYWVPVVALIVYVYGYRVGLGTVPIVMMGELLSVNVKVQGAVITDIVYTTASFSANAVFYITKNNLGMFAPFFIFALISLLGAVLSKMFVPETRGKTLEEIQFILIGHKEQHKRVEYTSNETKITTIA